MYIVLTMIRRLNNMLDQKLPKTGEGVIFNNDNRPVENI